MSDRKLPKKDIEKLSKKLVHAPQLVWDAISDREKEKVFKFGEAYKYFLDNSKTERDAVLTINGIASKNGFSSRFDPRSSQPFIKTFREKSVALVSPGDASLKYGINLIVSHIDSPRLDLKQRPLYEDVDLAFFKTHYYGGIKKFQWLARPLSIHGKILRSDGSHIDISIGEDNDDPVFTILDLLPHLAGKAQYTKKIDEAVIGEKLNVLIGGLPLGDVKVKERFKLAVLERLYRTYGLVEEDLISAELEVVPAGRARDVGFDRSLVGAYGQDDRASAFTSLRAILDMKKAEKSSVVLFVDKEEVGSDGATGAKSKFLESVIRDLMLKKGENPSVLAIDSLLASSKAISADLNGAIDPDYQDVHEKGNAARLGYGVCLTKFTGHRGKYGANDANAEYLGWLRNLLNRKKVIWQTGELGKVDEGGGGTVAKFLAVYGMEIVDLGPPALSMHSPFEITHKGDIYMAYKGFRAFLESSVE
ncbi:MAG: aminopeptidase [Deltaproteobacteria bacterium]|nr:aminopeptidase [Deltaproteobacteria bacterium]